MSWWKLARGSTELRRLTGHGGYDHERSRFDELTGVFWIDMTLFFKKKKNKWIAEGRKHKNTEMVKPCIYSTLLLRLELGQRDGGFFARLGKHESGCYEFKEVNQKRPELGMVSCESNQSGKNKICRKRR